MDCCVLLASANAQQITCSTRGNRSPARGRGAWERGTAVGFELDHAAGPTSGCPTRSSPPRRASCSRRAATPRRASPSVRRAGRRCCCPAQFAALRRTHRLHEVEPPELILRDTAVADAAVRAAPRKWAGHAARRRWRAPPTAAMAMPCWCGPGWGDGAPHEPPPATTATCSMRGAPGPGGRRLSRRGDGRAASNLLLLDTALVGCPAEHLVPEWTRLTPRPPCWPSDSARAYLAGYLEREGARKTGRSTTAWRRPGS